MTTQSIIVYNNPAQAAFWESGMAFPLFFSLGVGAGVFLILVSLAQKLSRNPNRLSTFASVICAGAALLSGAFTFHWMMNGV